jgi:hypothetical protein
MKWIALFVFVSVAGSVLAQEGQFQATQKKVDVIQKRPAVAAGEKLQPKGSGVVFMMSEKGLEVLNPLAPKELGRGEKNLTPNIRSTGPAHTPDLAQEDKRPYGGIVLVGLDF